ncbi:MAG: hypothetical protein Q9M40_05460 [Sulfurimonas sp.]|nr:hypothetical protein [Sulfurimonas sp.]
MKVFINSHESLSCANNTKRVNAYKHSAISIDISIYVILQQV